jgi:hypothetical protein
MPLKFLLEKDKSIMNRNKLLSVAENFINEKKNGYKPPQEPIFKLSGNQVMNKMFQTLENLFKENQVPVESDTACNAANAVYLAGSSE